MSSSVLYKGIFNCEDLFNIWMKYPKIFSNSYDNHTEP